MWKAPQMCVRDTMELCGWCMEMLFPLPLILVSVSFEEVRRHVFPMISHMLSARKKKTWKLLQQEEISDVFFDTSYIYEKAMGPIPELD